MMPVGYTRVGTEHAREPQSSTTVMAWGYHTAWEYSMKGVMGPPDTLTISVFILSTADHPMHMGLYSLVSPRSGVL